MQHVAPVHARPPVPLRRQPAAQREPRRVGAEADAFVESPRQLLQRVQLQACFGARDSLPTPSPSAPVQLQVKGTYALLQQEGGELSRKAKAKDLIFLPSTYQKILEQLQAYEALEAKGFSLHLEKIPKLAKIRILIMEWLDAADHNKDDTATAKRRLALEKALGVVTHEWQVLQAENLGNEPIHESSAKPLGSGALNSVDQVEYGPYRKTAFKSELDENKSDAAKEVGIPEKNPNFGNRNVAMYRLDQLLGTDVIPRTEFAMHGGYVGTVMDIAKGQSAIYKAEVEIVDPIVIQQVNQTLARIADPNTKPGDRQDLQDSIANKRVETDPQNGDRYFEKKTKARDFDYDSPQARKGMSNLQVVDALSGQLDRHVGNIYCETDKNGKVTAIKGIDNDLAFGQLHRDPKQLLDQWGKKSHDVGIPMLIDKQVGERILALKDKDIRKALEDLLTPTEIDATVSRFHVLKEYVKTHKKELVAQWDDQLVKQKTDEQDETRSYLRRDQEFVRLHNPKG
jgi:hypothetical protein